MLSPFEANPRPACCDSCVRLRTRHAMEPLAWHWSHWPDSPVNYDSSVDQSTVALQCASLVCHTSHLSDQVVSHAMSCRSARDRPALTAPETTCCTCRDITGLAIRQLQVGERHARPFVGAFQGRSGSHWVVIGAILWAFIAKS